METVCVPCLQFHNPSVHELRPHRLLQPLDRIHPECDSMISCSNPQAQYDAHKDEIELAIARVLGSGRYILGPEAQAFEKEFATFCGCGYGVGVNSGTDALMLTL